MSKEVKIPNSWFTRNYGLELDGSCPLEGWGIFLVENHLEVQKLDDSSKLSSDDEAKKLAEKRGIEFPFPDEPYRVHPMQY